MTIPVFCSSGVHCQVCLSKGPEGSRFRECIASVFGYMGDQWCCPHGVIPQDKSGATKTFAWLQVRIEACEGSEAYDVAQCPNWSETLRHCRENPACTPCYRRGQDNHCPLDKW